MPEKDPEDKDLAWVREQLRKAADIKDPRDMWYALRDILNLLTTMIVAAPVVITEETLARAEAMQG